MRLLLKDPGHFCGGFPVSSDGKESACNAEDKGSIPGSGGSPGEGTGYRTAVFLGFPGGSDGKESACNAGVPGLIAGFEKSQGRSPGGRHVNPLQYSCLDNSMDRISRNSKGIWWATVHGITKSQI